MVDRRDADTAAVRKGAETIDLQEEGSHGVLLLHGFGDTPQTLSLLAQRLHKHGYSVLVPLLPGHGRTMEAFTRSRADEWIDAARSSLLEMRDRTNAVSVAGLSMGGALAVLLAAEIQDISALILIAPYLGMPLLLRVAAATHWFWERFAGELNGRSPRSIHDPIEREKNLAYGAVTGRALHELSTVTSRARKALPAVTAPTLIVQSREDPRISPDVAEFALEALGAKEKNLVWTEGAGHIITVDYGRERVFSEVEKWLRAHDSRGATAAAE
ncbi:MAG TPA: alpha/beta fold hydrolase [Gemmatimonadaceae bacterium]|nr:alpha/beta fold hydrolase [Gemmatimonadaceae bacterium]